MTDNARCEIRCLKCNKWFPSQIQFGDAESYFGTSTKGNIVQCPHCGKMTGQDKDNMSFDQRDENGKVIHEEGSKTF